jgi:hypothetical protein
LVLVAKMSQNFVYDVLVFNTGNDLYRSTAARANLYIDVKHAFQALSPGHCGVTLGG